MTETVKVELSNEEDTLEMIAIAYGAPMNSDEFRSEVGELLENSSKYQGKFYLANSAEGLSVDELQKIRITELKDFSKKILQAELKNQKLQEQLNTAKKTLTEIASPNVIGAARIPLYRKMAKQALAALEGGEDD